MSNMESLDEILRAVKFSSMRETAFAKAEAALTRREERIKVEAQLDELFAADLAQESWNGDEDEGWVEYVGKRKNELEQQLKTLDGKEEL